MTGTGGLAWRPVWGIAAAYGFVADPRSPSQSAPTDGQIA